MSKGMIIGFGGYGKAFIHSVESQLSNEWDCLSIDTEDAHFVVSESEEEFVNNPHILNLVEIVKDVPNVYLVVAAGGEFGSYFSLLLAELLQHAKVKFTMLCTKTTCEKDRHKKTLAKAMEGIMNEMDYPHVLIENEASLRDNNPYFIEMLRKKKNCEHAIV